MGLNNAQGLILTTAFYWDMDDGKRAWAERFFKLNGIMPTQVHAGTYSAVMHYLKAVKAVGTTDTEAVMEKMREIPVGDPLLKGHIRKDGQMIHDMYLVQVKKIGRAYVCTPVPNGHIVCRLLLEKKKDHN